MCKVNEITSERCEEGWKISCMADYFEELGKILFVEQNKIEGGIYLILGNWCAMMAKNKAEGECHWTFMGNFACGYKALILRSIIFFSMSLCKSC